MPRRSGEGSLCQSSHAFGRQDRRQLGRCHRVVPASAGAHAILEAGNQAGQLGEPAQSARMRDVGGPPGPDLERRSLPAELFGATVPSGTGASDAEGSSQGGRRRRLGQGGKRRSAASLGPVLTSSAALGQGRGPSEVADLGWLALNPPIPRSLRAPLPGQPPDIGRLRRVGVGARSGAKLPELKPNSVDS